MLKEWELIPCDICGSTTFSIFWEKRTLKYVKCSQCGHVFVSPQWTPEAIKTEADELAKGYHATDERIESDFSSFIREYIHYPRLSSVEKYKKNGRLLDVGCATGAFMSSARMRGWEPFGIELSQVSARYGREVEHLDIHVGTLFDAGFASGYFDVVTMWEVIEHLPTPTGYLREVKRILREGGAALLSTPNVNSLTRLIIGKKWEVISPEEHLHLFSERTVKILFEKSGFLVSRSVTEDINPLLIIRNLVSRKRSDDRGEKRREIVALRNMIGKHRILKSSRRATNTILSRIKLGDTLVVLAEKAQ